MLSWSKQVRPWACCSQEKTRYALTGVLIRRTSDTTGELVASDGTTLTRIPCRLDPDDLTERIIPVEAFKAAQKAARRKSAPDPHLELTDNGCVSPEADGSPSWEYIEGRYPDPDSVTPDGPGTFRLCINAKRLSDITTAMGSDLVEIVYVGPRVALRVSPLEDGEGQSLLMPLDFLDRGKPNGSMTGEEVSR